MPTTGKPSGRRRQTGWAQGGPTHSNHTSEPEGCLQKSPDASFPLTSATRPVPGGEHAGLVVSPGRRAWPEDGCPPKARSRVADKNLSVPDEGVIVSYVSVFAI